MKAFILAVLLFVPITVAAHSSDEFLDLIDETKKSVVYVINTTKPGTQPQLPNIAPPGDPEAPVDPNQPMVGTGTGFIVEGGYIITNHHVIDNSEKLEVYFEDDPHPYPVEIVGADAAIDVAVLKPIGDFPKVKPLQWRTEKLRTGTEIWVLGHPGGFTYSVSKGIVSHLDRRTASPWQPTIQIDAAVNRGNSGGPLLDMDGYVVGINVMIVSRVAEFNGIALSVDGFTAQRAIEILISQGEIVRPLMGVMLGYDSDAFRVKASELTSGGAAELAGMKAGDLYLEVDGIEIININNVFDVLAFKQPDDIVEVKVLRGLDIVTLEVKLGRVPQ